MKNVSLLVGTTKGTFMLDGGADRSGWAVSGPFCDGWPINHVIGDPATGRLWAAGGEHWTGAGIWRSVDSGKTWALAKLSRGQTDDFIDNNPEIAAKIGLEPSGPTPFDGQVDAIWSLCLVGDTLYAGAKPASLFSSTNGGETWERLDALTNHPSVGEWEPGGAGLTLHTIVPDPTNPAKMWVAISAAGVFATEDGGQSWERRNRLSNAEACSHDHPAAGNDGNTGMCVHNMMRAPGGAGDVLYQQNHHGVFRSPDGGRSWENINEGLPSTFGFPIRVHPRDPETVWTLPLNGDSQGRYPPDASAAVWRTRDGGASWQDLRNGLPQAACFFTVLRQAMAGDTQDMAGVYFGTNTGSIFATTDEGDTWSEVARHLPTVLGVEVLERA